MRLSPGAVAIVAAGCGGERTGMAVTAWTSLSADPPAILVCANRSSSVHGLIQRAGAFSLSLLAADHPETVAIFSAQRGLHGSSRFLPGAWSEGPLGQPLLNDALAAFECRLVDAHEHASHAIFIGEVGALRRRRDASAALLYVDGGYATATPL